MREAAKGIKTETFPPVIPSTTIDLITIDSIAIDPLVISSITFNPLTLLAHHHANLDLPLLHCPHGRQRGC